MTCLADVEGESDRHRVDVVVHARREVQEVGARWNHAWVARHGRGRVDEGVGLQTATGSWSEQSKAPKNTSLLFRTRRGSSTHKAMCV